MVQSPIRLLLALHGAAGSSGGRMALQEVAALVLRQHTAAVYQFRREQSQWPFDAAIAMHEAFVPAQVAGEVH